MGASAQVSGSWRTAGFATFMPLQRWGEERASGWSALVPGVPAVSAERPSERFEFVGLGLWP